MTEIYIKNQGIAETNINNKKKTIEWNGEYDGKNGQVNIYAINNGEKDNMKIVFDNKDLLNLLNHKEVDETIDQRLINDFLTNTTKSKKRNKKRKTRKKLRIPKKIRKTR